MTTGMQHARLPALDGLRGLAILLVVACHSRIPGFASAGMVGVTVFFVLSGYLITQQLLADDGQDALRRFWGRRAWRLGPALLLLLIGVLPVAMVIGDYTLGSYWRQVWPALLYVSNWDQVLNGPQEPFSHLWSLAVEEQFYLVWPLVVVLALRRNRLWLLVACAAGAVASILVRVMLAETTAGLSLHAYLGTDGNAFGLLMGAGLAAFGPIPSGHRGWRFVAPLGVVLVALAAPWPGGSILLAIPAATGAWLLVAGASAGRTPRFLQWQWLGWFGAISYGWYLWHMAFLHLAKVSPDTIPRNLAASAAALVVAVASWRFVERPLLERHRRRVSEATSRSTAENPRTPSALSSTEPAATTSS